MMKKGQSCSIIEQHFTLILVLIVMMFSWNSAIAGTDWTDVPDGTAGADGDTIIIYDLSATANRELSMANFWTGYLTDKLNAGLVAGSATTPSIGFTADTNTGLYWVSADTIGFTSGGTGRFGLNTTTLYPITDGAMDIGTDAKRIGVGYFNAVRVDDPSGADDVGDRAYNDTRYGYIVETKSFSSEATHTFTISDSSKTYRLRFNLVWASGPQSNKGTLGLRFNTETGANHIVTVQRASSSAVTGVTLTTASYVNLITDEDYFRSVTGEVLISKVADDNTMVRAQFQTSGLDLSSSDIITVSGSCYKDIAAEWSSVTLYCADVSAMTGITGPATLEMLSE